MEFETWKMKQKNELKKMSALDNAYRRYDHGMDNVSNWMTIQNSILNRNNLETNNLKMEVEQFH
jgi:hypothetical protein